MIVLVMAHTIIVPVSEIRKHNEGIHDHSVMAHTIIVPVSEIRKHNEGIHDHSSDVSHHNRTSI